VIEKTKEPETEEPLGPCDIVAKKSGTIRNMLVLMGRPLVREGQTVTEGQVLVSGALLGAPRPSQDLDHMPNVAKYLHARAIIKAETTYQAYREVSIDEVRLVETGRVTKKLMITIGRTSTVWGLPSTEYSHFIVRANPVLPWSGRNTSPLVEVHQLTYHEIVPSQVALDVEEAKHRAQAMAIDAINSLLPPEAEKLDVKSETFTHPGLVGVLVTVTVLEDIGVVRPVKTD
jgi:similar to stage IV sporulation protein